MANLWRCCHQEQKKQFPSLIHLKKKKKKHSTQIYGCRTKCIKDIFLLCECWKKAAVLEVTQHYVFQRGGQTAGQAAAAAGVARMWWASWGRGVGGAAAASVRGLDHWWLNSLFNSGLWERARAQDSNSRLKPWSQRTGQARSRSGSDMGKRERLTTSSCCLHRHPPPPQASGGFLVNHTVSSRPTPQQVPGSASILKHHAERVSVVNAFAVRHHFRENYNDA